MKHSQSRFLALLLTAAMTLSSPAAAFAGTTDDTGFSDGLENFTSTPDENEESETITFSDKENTCSPSEESASEEFLTEDVSSDFADTSDFFTTITDTNSSIGEKTEYTDASYDTDNFTFSGGAGHITITCPSIEIKNGIIYGNIRFSSSSYTQLESNGVTYSPVSTENGSLFQIPVVLNEDMEIAGTTIAMGAPHTITYSIHISLDTAKLQKFSPEDTAAKWIKDNCDNIFAGCSDAYKAVITKDGDTYTIPYRASDNTIIASGIKLLRPDKSLYQSGWFFSTTDCFSRPSKTYSTSTTYSFSNVRFISQTDTEMTATLKLYDPATTTSAIKNNTATALASYTYTWIVQPKIEPYSVTLEAKDADGNLVTDPVYTVTDNYGNVITSSDAAVYQLYADRTYTITASAEDYTAEDGSEQAVIKDYIPSQDETKAFTLTQSPEAKAQKWIKDNCDNIFAGCSDAYKAVITKDGDTYTIPYRASDNTIIASGIKLLRPDKSLYQSGWFFSTTDCFSRPSKTYSTSTTYSFSNVRFISQTDTEMTATLKLYDPATTTSAIKNNTATALASYTYTWIVQPKIEPYSVTLEAKDVDGNLVTDPVYTVTDNYGNVITSSDAAVYQLYADRTYTITASAENYTTEDGSEQAVIKDFTPAFPAE